MTVSIYWLIVPPKWRSLYLLLNSLLLVGSIALQYVIYLFFNAFLVHRASNFIKSEIKSRKLILKLILIWLVGSFCFFKYVHKLFDNLPGIKAWFSSELKIEFFDMILPVGLSFVTFRLIHYVIEAYRRNIPEASFIDFLSYVIFFPTFFAGPIERFQKFHSQTMERKSFDLVDFKEGLFRISCGIIKKVLIVYYLTKFAIPVLKSPDIYSWMIVIVSIYGLSLIIYMDFSGYTDIAIGSARLFGYKIIENFNQPFFKENIALFWRNWHISFYCWIRDYFFFPLFGTRASLFKLYFGIFLTIMVVHFWHKVSIGFLIMGLYFVFGLSVWQLFQEAKKSYSLLNEWASKKWFSLISTAFTFSFVSFGFVLFYFDFADSLNIYRRVLMVG